MCELSLCCIKLQRTADLGSLQISSLFGTYSTNTSHDKSFCSKLILQQMMIVVTIIFHSFFSFWKFNEEWCTSISVRNCQYYKIISYLSNVSFKADCGNQYLDFIRYLNTESRGLLYFEGSEGQYSLMHGCILCEFCRSRWWTIWWHQQWLLCFKRLPWYWFFCC